MRRFALLLLAGLAGCGAPPLKAVSATGDQVVFEYDDDKAAEAQRQAALYCANLGRGADLREVRREDRSLSLAIFDCR